MKVKICPHTESLLQQFNHDQQQTIADAINRLEDDDFCRDNGNALILKEQGCDVYGLIAGLVWLAYFEKDGYRWVTNCNLRSKFRS